MSDLPKTIGLCPVCKDEFYMPDAKEGDGCPYNGADSFGDHHETLVTYVHLGDVVEALRGPHVNYEQAADFIEREFGGAE